MVLPPFRKKNHSSTIYVFSGVVLFLWTEVVLRDFVLYYIRWYTYQARFLTLTFVTCRPAAAAHHGGAREPRDPRGVVDYGDVDFSLESDIFWKREKRTRDREKNETEKCRHTHTASALKATTTTLYYFHSSSSLKPGVYSFLTSFPSLYFF